MKKKRVQDLPVNMEDKRAEEPDKIEVSLDLALFLLRPDELEKLKKIYYRILCGIWK